LNFTHKYFCDADNIYKLFGNDVVSIMSDNTKNVCLAYFSGGGHDRQKIRLLSVIQSTFNFQGLFVSKLNLKSENCEKKVLSILNGLKKEKLTIKNTFYPAQNRVNLLLPFLWLYSLSISKYNVKSRK